MAEERERARKYLYPSTLRKIENLCSEILVNDELERMSSVCRDIVQQERLQGIFCANFYKKLKKIFRPEKYAYSVEATTKCLANVDR